MCVELLPEAGLMLRIPFCPVRLPSVSALLPNERMSSSGRARVGVCLEVDATPEPICECVSDAVNEPVLTGGAAKYRFDGGAYEAGRVLSDINSADDDAESGTASSDSVGDLFSLLTRSASMVCDDQAPSLCRCCD